MRGGLSGRREQSIFPNGVFPVALEDAVLHNRAVVASYSPAPSAQGHGRPMLNWVTIIQSNLSPPQNWYTDAPLGDGLKVQVPLVDVGTAHGPLETKVRLANKAKGCRSFGARCAGARHSCTVTRSHTAGPPPPLAASAASAAASTPEAATARRCRTSHSRTHHSQPPRRRQRRRAASRGARYLVHAAELGRTRRLPGAPPLHGGRRGGDARPSRRAAEPCRRPLAPPRSRRAAAHRRAVLRAGARRRGRRVGGRVPRRRQRQRHVGRRQRPMYTGQFADGLCHGRGRYAFANGDAYRASLHTTCATAGAASPLATATKCTRASSCGSSATAAPPSRWPASRLRALPTTATGHRAGGPSPTSAHTRAPSEWRPRGAMLAVVARWQLVRGRLRARLPHGLGRSETARGDAPRQWERGKQLHAAAARAEAKAEL